MNKWNLCWTEIVFHFTHRSAAAELINIFLLLSLNLNNERKQSEKMVNKRGGRSGRTVVAKLSKNKRSRSLLGVIYSPEPQLAAYRVCRSKATGRPISFQTKGAKSHRKTTRLYRILSVMHQPFPCLHTFRRTLQFSVPTTNY
jgi:hypothetical protein